MIKMLCKTLGFATLTLFFGICFPCSAQTKKSTVGGTESLILGSISDNKYQNRFFGFELQLPEGWRRLDNEDIETAKKIGAESLKASNAKANSEVDKAFSATLSLLLFAKEPLGAPENASIGIEARKQQSSLVTAKMLIEATKAAYLKNPKTKLVADLRPETINRRVFQTVEFEIEVLGNRVPLRFHVIMVKGYSIAISSTYFDEQSKKLIEESIQSIRFGN